MIPLSHLLAQSPLIMGIVNVTTDSFADGGRYLNALAAIAHGEALLAAGAHILDVGGESTRPGAADVDEATELSRVIPVIESLARQGAFVSIDTQKPAVMRAAIAAGAKMVNDVNALQADGAVTICAEANIAVCLMHRQGTPATMQRAPIYGDAAAEVQAFLLARAAACEAAGIGAQNIVLDQGYGFGKTLDHNLALFRAIPALVAAGYPVLVGVSRKSMWQHLLGRAVDERLAASVVAAALAAQKGAAILRVHDVAQTRDALAVLAATQ